MKEFATANKLYGEHRNLLSVAYKNVVGSRRVSWRVVSAMDAKGANAELISDYIAKIVKELEGICTEVLVSLSSAHSLVIHMCLDSSK